MIAQNIIAAFIGLAVGVKAGPCKPSPVTTTTGTASTDFTSITSIATSGEPTTTTTTTEAATTTTSPGEYVCLKDPAPVGKGCNAQGGGQGDLQTMGNANTLTLASCYKSCLDRPGCIAISLQPGLWCALWAGSFTGTSGGESPWSWYDMDCFCDESSSTTSGLATGTTATEATTSELTTSSVELTLTTETAPATTTTTAPSYSCVNNEKQPLPAGKPCNKAGNANQNSDLNVMYNLHGAKTVSSCREACLNANGCSAFNLKPGSECWLYSGTLDGVIESESEYYWWSLDDCFCDESSTTTSGAATELTASSVEPTSITETAPATTTTTAPGESCISNEKNPAPSDKVCNKRGYYNGNSRTFLDSPAGVITMESCRNACHENNQCAFFAVTPGQSCYIYAGTLGVEIDQQMPYIWYDMDCFCDLDEPDY
ncbi:uncharacterized protein FTJAE_8341 [Fusarium tjaetaba]|uniref:Apple domain-containing protein n=1 Tax=Fusarium tjaetaba TaxID=1567544 RepID=A0A8H5VNN0_9HYPO|nr:uncharacterized protein FTJAE_8341 [Fusarium tjaetaba]KAF5629971.1 hypothetical protein FTJAE_8341 [Fusarium tjaetaba]